jgi:hypothetical protein
MNSNYGPSEEIDHTEDYAPANNVDTPVSNVFASASNKNDLANIFLYHCKRNQYLHMYSIFHSIVGVFAIYLSFKCNKGINVIDLVFAFFCPVLYIIFRTASCNELIRN